MCPVLASESPCPHVTASPLRWGGERAGGDKDQLGDPRSDVLLPASPTRLPGSERLCLPAAAPHPLQLLWNSQPCTVLVAQGAPKLSVCIRVWPR